jgi:hypothetical protein
MREKITPKALKKAVGKQFNAAAIKITDWFNRAFCACSRIPGKQKRLKKQSF